MWHSATRDLAVVLGASWLARIVFVAAIGDAHSLDVDYWQGALSAQDEGKNPYETGVLNWPPFWLQVIVAVDAVADVTNVAFWSALRVYLILVESALVVALYLTLVSVGAGRAAVRRALLVGIALNPVTIILVCQHGNSDVQVGLLVTLAAAALVAHWRTREVVLWLCGCLFIGLGVLAKTAPLVLAPILAPGARLASWPGRLLGAALLLGPAALGLSVLLALEPQATLDNVIGYRSTRGFWGFAGLLQEVAPLNDRYLAATVLGLAALTALVWLAGRSRCAELSRVRPYLVPALVGMGVVVCVVEALERVTPVTVRSRYDTAFTLAVLALVAWLGYRLFREEPLAPPQLFLVVAVILMIVVAFGPGYGAHYAYWFIPALIATYVLLDASWRSLLLVAYVVAGVTYGVEYAFVSFLGSYASAILGTSDWVTEVGDYLMAPHRWVLFRVPLFLVYLLVITAGVARLADAAKTERRPA